MDDTEGAELVLKTIGGVTGVGIRKDEAGIVGLGDQACVSGAVAANGAAGVVPGEDVGERADVGGLDFEQAVENRSLEELCIFFLCSEHRADPVGMCISSF